MARRKIAKTIDDVPKGLKEAIVKMCEIIDVNPKDIDFSDPEWFSKHEWTMEQMNKFIKWFSNKLIEDKEFRQSLLERSSKPSRTIANKAAMEFVLMYGWKFKDI